jgi:VIT1/CCC1 family predicted Fe2+/Mn2+ transporter
MDIKRSFVTGFSFGLTSGIITTLGLIVGLDAGTHSKATVIGGILTIAIADAFSDALGIHVSQESRRSETGQSIWESTVATFLSKFIFALTFAVPVLLFELSRAITIDIVWGMSLLAIFSSIVARERKESAIRAVAEHVVIAILVILITHGVGIWIASVFR